MLLASVLWACNTNDTEEERLPNVVVVSMDGLRWQELFTGVDSVLIGDTRYVSDTQNLRAEYWHPSPLERRKKLMPFMWNTVGTQGVLLGNRTVGNNVDCTNTQWFSYPGYNEILTGWADDARITSNDKIPNPNTTFLEYLHNIPAFAGSVAAFGSWDVFPYIINEERSGIPVNAGFEAMQVPQNERIELINTLQSEVPARWGTVRFDAFTHNLMLEYVKVQQPRVIYIAYGETDDFAHDGDYDAYVHAATRTDGMLQKLWEQLQSMEQYRDNTTLIITTDHGRGTNPIETWRGHGSDVDGAGGIWIAALGPEISALGEQKEAGQYYQNQVAATACEVLGVEYVERAGASLLPTLK